MGITCIGPGADTRQPPDDVAVLPGTMTRDTPKAYGSFMGPVRGVDRELVLDGGLALLVAVLGVTEVLVPLSTMTGSGSSGVAVVLVLLSCLSLAARRRFPLTVLLVCILPWGALALFTDVLVLFWGGLAPIAIAAYSVARHGSGRQPYLGLVAIVVGLALMGVGSDALQSAGQLFFPALVLFVAWGGGLLIARTHRVASISVRRADAAEERSREETLLAIAEERARIARDLHDVVAHAVTAMVVQAGAAQQVVDEDPEYVGRALEGIRQTGSQALEEMRRVVDVLRSHTESHALSPQPGVADLPALVAASGTTSTRVRLDIEGTPRRLTESKGLAAYRVVQEAITNVHRHSGARTVTVKVAYGCDSVRIEIRDDGIGDIAGAAGTPGHRIDRNA